MSLVCLCKRLPKEKERVDDGSFVYYPTRIGSSTLICGRRDSHFPFHLFVGPDWPCMLSTYTIIIVSSVLFLHNIGRKWGAPIFIVGTILTFTTLCTFSFAACSNPGYIFVKERPAEEVNLTSLESGSLSNAMGNNVAPTTPPPTAAAVPSSSSSSSSVIPTNNTSSGGMTTVVTITNGVSTTTTMSTAELQAQTQVPMIECGMCHIDRPKTGRHCYDCGLCVDELDHHCPWTGKCIGKRTLYAFYAFLTSLCFLLLFVVVMVVVSLAKSMNIVDFGI